MTTADTSLTASQPWIDDCGVRSLVSIIVPAFNRSGCVRDTLNSIRGQTYRPIEIVLVDDGSSDDTLEIMRQWAEESDDIWLTCRILSQSNLGVDVARNTATRASTGEFIQFLDSDDILHPRKIEQCVAAFTRSDVDTVVCRFREFSDPQEIAEFLVQSPRSAPYHLDPERRPFFTRMGWELWAPLYRRRLLAEVGPMDVGIAAGGTFLYTTRLKLKSKERVYLPFELILYRRGVSNALTSVGNDIRVPATAKVIQGVYQQLVREDCRDPIEWKNLARKALRAYCKSVVSSTSGGRADLYRVARSAIRKWNRIATLLYCLPEPIFYFGIRLCDRCRGHAGK